MDTSYHKRLPIWLKLILLIVFMGAIMAGVTIAVGYSTYSADNDEVYKKKAWALAGTQAEMLDPDLVTALRDMVLDTIGTIPLEEQVYSDQWGSEGFLAYQSLFSWIEETPEYREIRKKLSDVQILNELNSCYICYLDSENTRCIYLVDAGTTNRSTPGVIDPLGEANRETLTDPMRGFPPYISNTKEYGWLVTAGSPILDASGNVIAYSFVDISMNEIRKDVERFYVRLVIILLGFTGLLIAVFLLALNRLVLSPVKKLANAARKYTQERQLGAQELIFDKLPIHRGDEIGDLLDAMRLMEHEVNDYVRNLSAARVENEKISSELDVAMKLQMDIMPKTDEELSGVTAVELNALIRPSREVGGDFYDFFMIDRDHLAMVMADVSGKGIPATVFMIITKMMLKDRTLAGGSPAEVLEQVNRLLCKGNREQLFVTVWLGVLKLSTGALIMANAGHDYPALRHKNGEYELYRTENDPPVAAMEHMIFHDVKITLSPGDELFIYTDGIPEAKNADGRRFGVRKMLESLNTVKGMPAAQITRTVTDAVIDFIGDTDASDDVTMMSVLYRGDPKLTWAKQ